MANTPDNCGGKIGIFNLIDPDGDGKDGFIPDPTNPPTCTFHIPKDSVIIKILQWIDSVVYEGGDDPTTIINEEVSTSTPVRIEKESILDEWIRYAIYRGVDEGDCDFTDFVLSKLVTWKWQKQRYGQKIRCGDLDGASELLNEMSSENQNVDFFKEVQNINLKRFKGFGNGNWISTSELERLKFISESEYSSAGYARSLYRLLTGENLPISIPEVNEINSLLNRTNNKKLKDINIFPNPTNDNLTLLSGEKINRVRIISFYGDEIINLNDFYKINTIDVSSLFTGPYIIEIIFESGKSTCKIFNKL